MPAFLKILFLIPVIPVAGVKFSVKKLSLTLTSLRKLTSLHVPIIVHRRENSNTGCIKPLKG
ncbi:hypothetical protein THS27_00415 [Thalassospira sp. MCCC 1A01428]|nr:hypothetical protein THS27_00415 [Thalassospira sp. MCCC 1A01428]